MLDAPCGDFNWMKELDLSLERYVGADIVPELVSTNQLTYGSDIREFIEFDITTDVVQHVDLILCRDCLVHLPFNKIRAALRNFKQSGATYLLTTTFPQAMLNHDIRTGQWRPLNVEKSPLNFPAPLCSIMEDIDPRVTGDPVLSRKHLCLYVLESIPA